MDVLPDIQLGPVGEREHADALALIDAGIKQAPEFRALAFRVPAMVLVAEGEDALLGTGFFLVTTCATESRIKLVFIQRLLQPLGLHDVGVFFRAVDEGTDAHLHALLVDMDDQVHAGLFSHLVAELDHFAEFPGGIDVHQRKGWLAGVKGFAGQVQHHGRILAYRIEHHRALKFGSDFTDDVDTFSFELLEVCQTSC